MTNHAYEFQYKLLALYGRRSSYHIIISRICGSANELHRHVKKNDHVFLAFCWWRAKTFPEKSETRKHQMQGKLLHYPLTANPTSPNTKFWDVRTGQHGGWTCHEGARRLILETRLTTTASVATSNKGKKHWKNNEGKTLKQWHQTFMSSHTASFMCRDAVCIGWDLNCMLSDWMGELGASGISIARVPCCTFASQLTFHLHCLNFTHLQSEFPGYLNQNLDGIPFHTKLKAKYRMYKYRRSFWNTCKFPLLMTSQVNCWNPRCRRLPWRHSQGSSVLSGPFPLSLPVAPASELWGYDRDTEQHKSSTKTLESLGVDEDWWNFIQFVQVYTVGSLGKTKLTKLKDFREEGSWGSTFFGCHLTSCHHVS